MSLVRSKHVKTMGVGKCWSVYGGTLENIGNGYWSILETSRYINLKPI